MHPRINIIDDFSLMNGRLKDMTPLEKWKQHHMVLSYWVEENYRLRQLAVEPAEQAHLDKVIALIEKLQADALKKMVELGHEVVRGQ